MSGDANPYDSPREVRESKGERPAKRPSVAYRVRLFPTFVILWGIISAGWTAGWLAIDAGTGAEILVAPIGGAFMGMPLSVLLVLYFRVFVSPEGIRCFDFWGVYHFVPWESISDVKRVVLFPGVAYLTLKSDAQPTLWLPLYLAQPHAFWGQVRPWLNDDSPLGVWLTEQRT